MCIIIAKHVLIVLIFCRKKLEYLTIQTVFLLNWWVLILTNLVIQIVLYVIPWLEYVYNVPKAFNLFITPQLLLIFANLYLDLVDKDVWTAQELLVLNVILPKTFHFIKMWLMVLNTALILNWCVLLDVVTVILLV
jgi:hypothetical protein